MGLSQSDETPEPGDLIEIFRGGYQHWAVYVGDGYVVHVTSPPGADVRRAASNTLTSVPTKKAMVRREKLREVVGDNKWRINNILDKKYKPRSPDIIVKEALRQVDNLMEYSVISENCEHFATKLRYGKPVSRQVHEAEQAAAATGIIAAVGGAVVATAAIVASLIRN
ncbi:phospholipase A and acyltransferase 4-like isoform X3 [Acanthopagrus latus]|uniref:phospholipase A and acyltransferase 4-like isoform X3 n=1 Tax=Acanthopagrus latus TaxID=8177 RepID=UPI00187C274C|nr:phospholipase A and acyltransferase 4-like isoform X3 [Acanthopagrus latus]